MVSENDRHLSISSALNLHTARRAKLKKDISMFKKTIATAVIFTGVTLVPVAIAAPHGEGALGGGAPHASVGAAPAARSAGPSFRGPGASAARVYGWRSRGGARHAFHHRGRGVGVYDYGYYDGDYGYGGCGYLYSRAVATGSSYWWRRYQACEG